MDNWNNNNRDGFGGIFKNIVNNANNKLNSKKAYEIKRKLIIFGIAGCVLGFITLVLGIVLFVSTGMSFSFSAWKIGAGMGLFMLGGMILGLGSSAASAGFKIVIAGMGADIADTYEKCPKCGDKVETDEAYCDKCGEPLLARKKCECGKQNDVNSKFCRSCGKELK